MTPEQLKMNKDAAEALGWRSSDNGGTFQCVVPNHLSHLVPQAYPMGDGRRICYEYLHFHDSYDWAMLLVKKALKDDVVYFLRRKICVGGIISVLEATPQKISQACLEVLGG